MTDDAKPLPPDDPAAVLSPDAADPAAGPVVDPADGTATTIPAASRSETWTSILAQIGAHRPTLFGVTLALLLVIASARLGFLNQYANGLQGMGFDPDRAVLIRSLLLGAIAAVVVAVAGGWFTAAVVTGAGVALAAFYQVFREETRAAMRSQAPDGTFDPIGWGLSALTLVSMTLVVGWLAAVVGRDMASRLNVIGSAVGDVAARRGRSGRAAGHLVVVIAIIAVVALTIPTFVDMLTLKPDSHMRH
jgi:hypothetical protein